MKKSLLSPILTIVVLLLVIGLFVYFYISLNRMDKKIIATQTAISQNSGKINAVVNFFNSNARVNAQKK